MAGKIRKLQNLKNGTIFPIPNVCITPFSIAKKQKTTRTL